MNHLIEDKSQSPYITFRSIDLAFQYLWRHIQWRSNSTLNFQLFIFLFSKSKITNFCFSFTQHDIRWFKISINRNAFTDEQFLILLMKEIHYKFMLRMLLLIVMLFGFAFITNVIDLHHKAIVLCSNCECFTSRRKVPLRFKILLSVRFEFTKVMRISCTHRNQL